MGLLMVSDNPKILETVNKQSLSSNQLAETEWMHPWIKDNFQRIFGELGYELIGQEVNVTGAGSEGYLDFLALDIVTGATVILEIKRDDFKNRDLIGQVIEYASGISRFSIERLNEVYHLFINDTSEVSIEELIEQSGYQVPINQKQKMIMVVQDSPKNQGSMLRLKAACSYLTGLGIDINILEISWYTSKHDVKEPSKGDIIDYNFAWDIETTFSEISSQKTAATKSAAMPVYSRIKIQKSAA